MPLSNSVEIFPHTMGKSLAEVIGYTLPKLHEGAAWYIDFVALNPLTGTLKRKKYMVPSAPTLRERRDLAAEIIFSLTAALRGGWSPWTGGGNGLRAVPWAKICESYEKYIYRISERGMIKKSSYQSYQSYFRIFKNWLAANHQIVYVHQLTSALIVDFLEYLILEDDVSARTRNNYLVWISTFGQWLVGKGALDANPATGIPKIKESEKFREQLSPEVLQDLRSHLTVTDPHFLLACMMEYYTFIRPEELCAVTIGDISVKDMRVNLHAADTKNRKDGAVGLNEEIIKLMISLGTLSAPSHYYLFGDRNFTPSPRKQHGRIFRERFQKLRKTLKWPASYQFYSLKDTGIRDLANSEGIVIARDQARHSDISTTNKYLKGDSCRVHVETKRFKGKL